MATHYAGSIVTLLLLFVASVSIPVLPFAAAQTSGDRLIKASTAAVYYLGDDGKRYVFPNERIFFSWYRDFSAVQTVSDAELASYPIGGSIFYRPGTRLVKITTDPKVYAVGLGGALYDIASEEAAVQLYGSAWSQRVDDLPDAFFSSYRVAGSLAGNSHPAGTFFRYVENISFYVLGYKDSTLFARPVSESLIASFRLNKSNALPLSSAAFPYPIGPDWQADEAAAFFPHQRDVSVPAEPGQQPGTDGENGAPAATATVTVGQHASLSGSQKAVVNDPASRVLALTLKGDPNRDVTFSRMRFSVYIDAAGPDADFSLGSDSDSTIFWPAGQIMSDFALRDIDSNMVLSAPRPLDPTGILDFPVSFTIKAGEQKHIQLTGKVNVVPQQPVRVSADIAPGEDITASVEGAALTVSPATGINGGTSPSTILTPVSHGTLIVDSKTETGDRMEKVGSDVTVYTLTLTAQGEPFRVAALALSFTPGGSNIYAVNHLAISYPQEDGSIETENEHEADANAKIYRYINLGIYVPKDATITIPFVAQTKDDLTLASNARLQFDFTTESFHAQSQYTNLPYTIDHFADSTKMKDDTSVGSLVLLRQGFLSFKPHPETPTGQVTRYNKIPVLTFSVAAEEHDITLRQLTIRVDTSNVDEDGDDNDFFENAANTFPSNVIGMASHHLDIDERTIVAPQSVTFELYDASTGAFDDTPDGIQTNEGDYGLFTLNFGSNPLHIEAGTSRDYDIDINTVLITSEHEETIKVRLLGDIQSITESQANVLWNDGSNILGTGYLVPGLDLLGFTLSVL